MNPIQILKGLLLLLKTIGLLLSNGMTMGLPGPEGYGSPAYSDQDAVLSELPARAKRGVFAFNDYIRSAFYHNKHNVELVYTCHPGVDFSTPHADTEGKTGTAYVPPPQALRAGRPKGAGTAKPDFLKPLCAAFPELRDLIQKNGTSAAQVLNGFAEDLIPTVVDILGSAGNGTDIRNFLLSNECYNRRIEPMLKSPAFSAIHLNSSDIETLNRLVGRLGDSTATLDEAEVLPTVKYLLSRSLHDVLVYVRRIYMEVYNTIYNVEFEEFYQIVGAYLFNGEAERMHRPLHDRMLNLLPYVLKKSLELYVHAQQYAMLASHQKPPTLPLFGDLTVDDVRTSEVFRVFNSIKCLVEHAFEELQGGAESCSKISANFECPFSVPVRQRPNPAEDSAAHQIKHGIDHIMGPVLVLGGFAICALTLTALMIRNRKLEIKNQELGCELEQLVNPRDAPERPDENIAMEGGN
ncbi:hypothetical protein PAPHI01_1701 [Pancytospora philotis]|nr:hypothetical protein PAPHI01_1701 [Pancytospora philotis]